jgi:hypothetical protein
MGLFFDVLSSINNPNQQGSVEQLSGIMSAIQQLSASNGIQPSTMQTAVSALGGVLGPALKQQQMVTGGVGLDSLIAQFTGGSNPGLGALSALLTPNLQQQLIQTVAQKSGISSSMIQQMLPVLIPAVMGLLGMGRSKPGATAKNNLLEGLLNPQQSGGADLGEVIKFAGRFLHPAR